MRITFALPEAYLQGGVRVVAVYADLLRRRGHHIVVVSLPPERPSLRKRARFLRHGWGWLSALPRDAPSHFDGLGVEQRILDRPRPITDDDVPDADVVVASWWQVVHWVSRLSAAKGAKVQLIQGYETDTDPDGIDLDAAWRLPMQKICVAQWLVDLARDKFGDRDAVLVPNAVDTAKFNAPPRGRQAHPTIGLLYSTERIKGCDISLEALRIASATLPAVRVVAFGACPLWGGLPLPPGSRYARQPPQDQIRHIYASCDAWLFGSRQEGFGLPILEAMACRTPVIATPAGAAPELLAGGGGLRVHPEDPRGMARAILDIACRPEDQWRSMSDAAYATATRYTWEHAADLFESAMLAAASRPRKESLARQPPAERP